MTQPAIAEAMGQDHWLAISGIVKHAALHGDSLATFAHFDRGYPASQEMTGGRDGPAGLGEAPRWAGLARAIIAWKAAFMIESIMYFGIGFLSAALSVLVVVPAVHGRAVRLTNRQLEREIPRRRRKFWPIRICCAPNLPSRRDVSSWTSSSSRPRTPVSLRSWAKRATRSTGSTSNSTRCAINCAPRRSSRSGQPRCTKLIASCPTQNRSWPTSWVS